MTLQRLSAHLALSLTCGLAAGLPLPAQATYQLYGMARAHATTTAPVPGLGGTDDLDVNLLNKPGAGQLQALDTHASNDHGSATARFLGRIGLLKAYATSDYAYCCIGGTTVHDGYADATVQGRFYDEVLVQGAGLADGTPVSYRLDLRLSGTVTRPNFESGGRYSADALAEAGLRDLSTGAAANFSWDARRQDTGVFSLTVQTAVGHRLAILGMLYAGTYVAAGALVARSAEVDFYHSAGYTLAPSVAGLSTLGESGYDFSAAAVPEPGTWALLLAGGLLLALRARQARR
ncbi:PEP-CTERM sorting domain-containing protein [Aquabacterium sp. OR-4]|uniref:PEP-CTERM sorting domain-containing protein n=1 Tax=Aquabacterium sp. OR-4 TaxID=2978127 RepID=UPI0021B4956F|nr:PEP-CTERM sorting domain-containing protein [Aquabacterium sp. OR-4]MDT7836502.1 PEP-CTERM sorting domain-containing protein [Aquabacterium sp. OR-4]